MADPTYSPYNFVPLPEGGPERGRYPGLDRLGTDSYSGVLTCTLTVLTRLFSADHQKASPWEPGDSRKVFPFLRNSAGNPMLQGTTLKGMVRSVYEAAFPSCLPLVAATGLSKKSRENIQYRLTLPTAYATCSQVDQLCPACRLFGIAQGDDVHAKGRVIFSDARLTAGALEAQETKLAELSSPKPHHYAIYSRNETEGGPIRGRKLFYHHDPELQAPVDVLSKRANVIREFAPRDSVFTFEVRFENLGTEELKRLVSCLVLDDAHAHKLGMAKPLGYGSCAITIREAESCAARGGERYQSWGGAKPKFETSAWTLPSSWLTGELEELLRHKRPNVGSVGYLRFNAYAGRTLDDHGRYVPAKSPPLHRSTTGPTVSEPKKPAQGFTQSLQPSTQEKGSATKRNRAVLEVVSYEAGVYTLRDPETQQEGIKFQGGGVRWEIGKTAKVRIVETTKDGKIIKKIQPG